MTTSSSGWVWSEDDGEVVADRGRCTTEDSQVEIPAPFPRRRELPTMSAILRATAELMMTGVGYNSESESVKRGGDVLGEAMRRAVLNGTHSGLRSWYLYLVPSITYELYFSVRDSTYGMESC